jgi:hypothetical protein
MDTETRETNTRGATRYAGADWLRANKDVLKEKRDPSPLGALVADVLGQTWEGIYHLRSDGIRTANWADPHFVEICLSRKLCTVDGNHLTRLVVLCHDHALRLDIQPCNPKALRLVFSRRDQSAVEYYRRCPTLEDHAALIRSHLSFNKSPAESDGSS